MSAGIDRRGTIWQVGEAGRIAIEAEEERRMTFYGSPFELAELANRWSAIFPEQLPGIGIGGEATDGIGVRAQVIGAIQSPLATFVVLLTAPLRDLVSLIDARIAQLEEQGGGVASSADAEQAIGEGPASDEAASVLEASGADIDAAEATDPGEEPATTNDEPTDIAQPEAEREEEQ